MIVLLIISIIASFVACSLAYIFIKRIGVVLEHYQDFEIEISKLTVSVVEMKAKLYKLEEADKDKQEQIAQREKEIEAFEQGLANICNYNADIAKRGKKE